MKNKGLIAKYKLLKELPGLNAGVIFEHREYDTQHPDRGNFGCGVMILGWINGGQGDEHQQWCGETFIFPGQLANNKEWFEKIEDANDRFLKSELKEDLLNQINELKKKIEKL